MTGISVGWFFSQNFALLLIRELPERSPRLAVAFSVLVAITVITGWLICLLLGQTLKRSGLSLLERLGGAVLGSVHGAVIVLTFILLAGLTSLPKDSWWPQSNYIPFFQELVVNMKRHSDSKLALLINYSPRLKLQAK